jgi:hypothetical protein
MAWWPKPGDIAVLIEHDSTLEIPCRILRVGRSSDLWLFTVQFAAGNMLRVTRARLRHASDRCRKEFPRREST